jgi:6-phosphofructokinase 1
MRVGILTGGGDVPGLNASIKAATLRAVQEGHEVVGIRRGWAGLLETDPDDPDSIARNVVPLDPNVVRTIDRSGGTFLHTSRTNPAKVKPADEPAFLRGTANGDGADGPRDHTPHAIKALERLGIDAMLPIGGDDTLSFALRLHDEGYPVIAIPKTMDNDVHGTDYCIGFSTAITRTVNFIHQLRTSAGSHERLAVFLMSDRASNPSRYAMMTISEGATMVGGEMVQGGAEDAFGHKKLGGIGQVTGELLKEITGEGIIYQQLGYLMRSGSPDSLDLMVAINYAVMAADLMIEQEFGRLVALRNGNYVNVPLPVLRQGVKRVDVGALYDVDNYRPKIRHVDGKPMFLY